MDPESVPATMNKSGLKMDAEELSQDTQKPSTMLVWIDRPPFAGAGRLENHARVSRWETSDCRWKQNRDIDDNSGTCRVSVDEAARHVKDMTDRVTPATAEVPDATDSPINEFERMKESGEQFFGARDVLEQLTQKVAIARDEGRLAEEAERSWHEESRERGEV